jgi:putative transposase
VVVDDADSRSGLQRVAEDLLHDDALIAASIEQILGQLETYASVERDKLTHSIRRNMNLAARTIEARAVPRGELWQAEKATLERLDAGVPVEDMMAAFRISIARIQARAVELARKHDVPDDDVVTLTGLLWSLSDTFLTQATKADQVHAVELAVSQQRRRDEWLSSLLRGALTAARLSVGAAEFRLPKDVKYRAVCILGGATSAGQLVREALGPSADGAMVTPVDGDLVGIVRAMPHPTAAGVRVCVGPEVLLDKIPESFDMALIVRDALAGRDDAGVFTIESLGWEVAVPRIPELGALLRARYLTPVLEMGAIGQQILHDLAVYLGHDRNIPRTAAALNMHVNTLRYRLSRFERATGRSLLETDTIIELAWALKLPRES